MMIVKKQYIEAKCRVTCIEDGNSLMAASDLSYHSEMGNGTALSKDASSMYDDWDDEDDDTNNGSFEFD